MLSYSVEAPIDDVRRERTFTVFGRPVAIFYSRIEGIWPKPYRPGPYLTSDDFGMRGVCFSLVWRCIGVCWWPSGEH